MRLRDRLGQAVRAVSAPDVVFAALHRGQRAIVTGGTHPPPAGHDRTSLRFEIGSATKTFTALLLAELANSGELSWHDPVVTHLPDAARHPRAERITLRQLATHTSGLPRLPLDIYQRALLRWGDNPYADYSTHRLLATFAATRPRTPGTVWRYSNFGYALLGHALAGSTGYAQVLADRVLRPLGLAHTGTRHELPAARGCTARAAAPVPPLRIDGFAPAGAVRSTVDDLLTYLAAHLDPTATPLAAALRAVRVPLLAHGLRRQHVHSLGWFVHPGDRGDRYFHAGATFGHTVFLGFQPTAATAVVALASRRSSRRLPLVGRAYQLLTELADLGP